MRFNLGVTTFQPMLLAPASELPCRPGIVYDPKVDGMRAVVSIVAGTVHVASRHGRNWTACFPELAALGAVGDAMLDGELVVLSPHGRPDFSLLQSRLATRDTAAHLHASRLPATYYVFDLVQLGDQDLCPQPWTIRRAALENLELAARSGGVARLLPYTTDGPAMHRLTAELGFEGTCAKRADGPYLQGRRTARGWLKIKHHRRGWYQVFGWKPATAHHWGGLVVGEHDKPLAVATLALPTAEQASLLRLMRRYGSSHHPTGTLTVPREAVEADVEYLEQTVTGKLREAVVRAVRPAQTVQ